MSDMQRRNGTAQIRTRDGVVLLSTVVTSASDAVDSHSIPDTLSRQSYTSADYYRPIIFPHTSHYRMRIHWSCPVEAIIRTDSYRRIIASEIDDIALHNQSSQRRRPGRHVAFRNLRIQQYRLGEWIRPVGTRSEGELNDLEVILSTGKSVEVSSRCPRNFANIKFGHNLRKQLYFSKVYARQVLQPPRRVFKSW